MKKLLVVALIVALGVSAGYASSLKVPWWVDLAPVGAGYPPSSDFQGVGYMGLVYLGSNVDSDLVCSITYYSETGEELPRLDGDGGNTFVIPAKSTVAFRPGTEDPTTDTINALDPSNAAYDPDFAAVYTKHSSITTGANGQESKVGVLIPDIPGLHDDNPDDIPFWGRHKPNGSIVIEWVGSPTDLQGQYTQVASVNGGKLLSYAHLLPAGN